MLCSSKMKSNIFLIIICVTMSFIICRPAPDEDEDDIFGKCLKEMGTTVQRISDLDGEALADLRRRVDIKLRKLESKLSKEIAGHKTEKRNRLLFQSFIAVYEFVDDLFADCWPKWAPNKPNTAYTSEQWKILLSNVENKRILAVRTSLEKHKVSEDDFIAEAQSACLSRHAIIHKTIMKQNDTSKAIKIWTEDLKVMNPDSMIILLTGHRLQLDPIYQEQAVNKANQYRNGFNLLKIPAYEGTEGHLEMLLDYFYNEPYDPSCTKYNGFVVVDKAAYVTFENFLSAHHVWNKWVHNIDIPIAQKKSIILNGSLPIKLEEVMYINLTIDVNDLAAFELAMLPRIKNIFHRPESRETYKSKQQLTNTIEIFYKFSSAYPAIQFYSLCKKEKPGMVKFLPTSKADLIEYTNVENILVQDKPYRTEGRNY